MEWLARVNGLRWYGHVLRREEEHALRKGLEFEVNGLRKTEGIGGGRDSKGWLEKGVHPKPGEMV